MRLLLSNDDGILARGLETLEKAGRAPAWIKTAEERGLGIGDPQRLRVVTR